jgi:hypothetical protein
VTGLSDTTIDQVAAVCGVLEDDVEITYSKGPWFTVTVSLRTRQHSALYRPAKLQGHGVTLDAAAIAAITTVRKAVAARTHRTPAGVMNDEQLAAWMKREGLIKLAMDTDDEPRASAEARVDAYLANRGAQP